MNSDVKRYIAELWNAIQTQNEHIKGLKEEQRWQDERKKLTKRI